MRSEQIEAKEEADYEAREKEDTDIFQVGKHISASSVGIYNKTNYSIKILLGVTPNLKAYEIGINENWISPSYQQNPEVQILTGGDKYIRYQLELSKSYFIFWNTRENHWDLKEF